MHMHFGIVLATIQQCVGFQSKASGDACKKSDSLFFLLLAMFPLYNFLLKFNEENGAASSQFSIHFSIEN